jgi:hypothetical protein
LEWLHWEIAGGCPCVLILDVYPAHRTEIVVNAAGERDIELLFVPADGTSEYQPLDHRIFGELNSRARAEITRLIALGSGVDIDHDQAVTILERCWHSISASNIRKAWDCPASRNLEPMKEQSHSIVFMFSSLVHIKAISDLPGATTCVGVTEYKAVDGNIEIRSQES